MGNQISLEKASTSSQLKSAVDSLPRDEKHFTTQVRDLLIAKKHLIVDVGTAVSVVKFLFSFSRDVDRRLLLPLLRTNEVHDLIINNIAPYVTAIFEFGRLIFNIVQNKRASDLFCGFESLSAILKCFHRSTTSEDAKWIASSINNILLYNPSSNKLLNSLPVVEAFSFIIPLANDEDAVERISTVLQAILRNNEEAQQKFGTPELFNIFQGMENHSTVQSNTQFQTVRELLMKK